MTNPLIASRDRFAVLNPEQSMTLNGRSWGIIDIGVGPALVLIPGTLGRGDIFWQQVKALSGRLRIVALSYPVTGSVADWCRDLTALLDGLNLQSATFLGSSLGGYLVQHLAAVAPDRLDKVIAANTLPSAEDMASRMPYALDLNATPIDDLREGFRSGLEAWRSKHPDQSDLVDLLLMEVGGRIPEQELRQRLIVIKNGSALPTSGLPTGRIFTVEADDDPLISPQMRVGVRDRLSPDVAYRFLSGGHFPYLARPDHYTALIEQIMGLNITGPDWGSNGERSL